MDFFAPRPATPPTRTRTSSWPAARSKATVNPVSAMVSMIANARQFQMQTKLMESADQNEQSANKLLNFS